MARYSIEDTTLTNIANAIRDRANGWTDVIVGYKDEHPPLVEVSKTSNALSFAARNGGYPSSATLKDTITIPGAVSIEVIVAYQTESTNYDYLVITSGKTASSSGTKLGGTTLLKKTYTYENTDSVSFYFRSDGSGSDYLGYYAEIRGFDAEGNQILSEETIQVPIYEQRKAKEYKPADMADAIKNEVKSKIILTGDLGNTASIAAGFNNGGRLNIYNSESKVDVETVDVTQLYAAFYKDTVSNQPVVINFKPYAETYLNSAFEGANNIPKIIINGNKAVTTSTEYAFKNCYKLKEIETNDFTMNLYCSGSSTKFKSDMMFQNCYSLRRINFLDQLCYKTPDTLSKGSYHVLYYAFYNCYSFDEIVGLPLYLTESSKVRLPASTLNSTFIGCERLKRLTFTVQGLGENNAAYGIEAQTMDLSTLGYGEHCALYNDDFNESNRVVDDATYQALKDDPDWWTSDVNYSRYNHDSAVETINSLPNIGNDSYASTIKFKGEAGTLTDGGAINTLTEEEIAVATSKRWTVAFV